MQSYKIYINEKPIILIGSKSLDTFDILEKNVLICEYSGQIASIQLLVNSFRKNDLIDTMIIHSSNLLNLVDDFFTIYPVIKASGGLIRNEKNEFLFIFRRGHWDLPKGKLEKHESKKSGAIREVIEETGINNVKIIDKIGITYHIFKGKRGRELTKKSHWYLMRCLKQKLTPQVEEDIEVASWKKLDEASKLTPIYNNIKDIIALYKENSSTY